MTDQEQTPIEKLRVAVRRPLARTVDLTLRDVEPGEPVVRQDRHGWFGLLLAAQDVVEADGDGVTLSRTQLECVEAELRGAAANLCDLAVTVKHGPNDFVRVSPTTHRGTHAAVVNVLRLLALREHEYVEPTKARGKLPTPKTRAGISRTLTKLEEFQKRLYANAARYTRANDFAYVAIPVEHFEESLRMLREAHAELRSAGGPSIISTPLRRLTMATRRGESADAAKRVCEVLSHLHAAKAATASTAGDGVEPRVGVDYSMCVRALEDALQNLGEERPERVAKQSEVDALQGDEAQRQRTEAARAFRVLHGCGAQDMNWRGGGAIVQAIRRLAQATRAIDAVRNAPRPDGRQLRKAFDDIFVNLATTRSLLEIHTGNVADVGDGDDDPAPETNREELQHAFGQMARRLDYVVSFLNEGQAFSSAECKRYTNKSIDECVESLSQVAKDLRECGRKLP